MAEERVYLIRVSAVLDRSTAAAVGDFVQQHERAQRTTERRTRETADRAKKTQREVADSSAKEQERAAKAIAKSQADIAKQFERNTQRRASDEDRARQRQVREDQRAFDQRIKSAEAENRKKEKLRRDEERDIVQEAKRAEKREEAAAKKSTALAKQVHEERKQQVKRLASDVYRDTAAVVGKAMDVGGRIAGGMGVNFDVGAGVAKAVQLERMAVGIVNAGNRGGGSAGERDAEVSRLQKSARDVGNKYAFDPTAMLSGYAQFQAKTGDTATATAGMDRFAKLAKATNTDLSDMLSMAGEISSKLEDGFTPGEKRAQETYEIMKRITAQGMEGAIEVPDMAKEIARIGGGAGFFKGGVGDTIGKLGAFAQMARATGGANSPADAARSVAAFVTTLKTPARRAAFDKYGVDYKAKDGSFLDPLTIVRNALKASGGDTEKMNNMFKSSLAEKSVASLSKTYMNAGGGDTGLAAIDKMFEKFNVTIDEKTIDEDNTRAMGTKESKGILFQNRLDVITASLADRVLPAFEKLAPDVEKVASAFADIVTWAASNPLGAIGFTIAASLSASIAKAAIGEAMSKAIAGSIGAQGGLALGALTLVATTAYLIAKEYTDKADKAEGSLKDDVEKRIPDLLVKAQKQLSTTGTVDKDTLNELAMARANMEGSGLGKDRTGATGAAAVDKLGWTAVIASKFGAGGEQIADAEGRSSYGKENMAGMADVAAKIDALVAQIAADRKKGPQHVIVDNQVSPPNGVVGTPDH